MVGAALMGLFALVRVAPKAELITFATLSATGGMMLIPMLLRATPGPHGLLYRSGEAVQLAGILISQISRIYLGRSFGLLPANRGIVSARTVPPCPPSDLSRMAGADHRVYYDQSQQSQHVGGDRDPSLHVRAYRAGGNAAPGRSRISCLLSADAISSLTRPLLMDVK